MDAMVVQDSAIASSPPSWGRDREGAVMPISKPAEQAQLFVPVPYAWYFASTAPSLPSPARGESSQEVTHG